MRANRKNRPGILCLPCNVHLPWAEDAEWTSRVKEYLAS